MDLISISSLVLSGVLVVITGVYAWLTYLIADRTKESANAALGAAQASERAAAASERMATLAEASLSVSFEASPDRHSDGVVWVTLIVRGANIWLHSAKIDKGVVLEAPNATPHKISPAALEPVESDEKFPLFISGSGSGISLLWPGSPFRPNDWGCGCWLSMEYSLAKDSERIQYTHTFEKPKDFYHVINDGLRLLPDLVRTDAVEKPSGETGGEA